MLQNQLTEKPIQCLQIMDIHYNMLNGRILEGQKLGIMLSISQMIRISRPLDNDQTVNPQNVKKNNVNSRKSSSNNRVIDLNLIRNKEKQMKQARVGIHGTQFDKMISKTNFSKMTKNYAINVCNLRTNEVKGPHQFYSAKGNELGSKTERSYSNLSQQNKTRNSRYQEGKESILSEERLQDIDNRSRTQQEIPNGILQLRKQMLNQEYQILEEQKKELQMTNLSPDTKEIYMQSQHDTLNNLEQELNKERNPHNFDLNKNYP